MATFKVQIEDMVGSVGDDTALTSWLTDGAKEIINIMPEPELSLVSAQQTFTSAAVGSEAETLNTGKISHVFRNDGDIDQPCRPIQALFKGRASDPYDMQYASVTDPVFYIENNKLNALPDGGSCKYSEVQYPAVANTDSAISVFPDEYEYLVVLYAAVKGLQRRMNDKLGDSDISTALTAVNTELDELQSIADNVHTEIALINTQSDSAVTEIGLANTEVDKMAAEVALANAEIDKATAEVALSNTEADKMAAEVILANAEIDKAVTEIGLANAEVDEAVTLVDSSIDTATAAIATAAGRINTAVGLANGQFDAAVLESAQAESEVDDSKIDTALDLINSQSDSAVSAISSVNTALGNANTRIATAKADIDLAKTEAAEIATQTDNSGDFETALDAINSELDKVDDVIVEASVEFDKADNVIVEGSVEIDKSTALLDLGETDSEGAVNTAAAKIITELDETQAVCDKIDADLVLAKAEVVLAKAEAAELATQTDNGGDFETAVDAMAT